MDLEDTNSILLLLVFVIYFVEYCFKFLISFGLGFLEVEENVYALLIDIVAKGSVAFVKGFSHVERGEKLLEEH